MIHAQLMCCAMQPYHGKYVASTQCQDSRFCPSRNISLFKRYPIFPVQYSPRPLTKVSRLGQIDQIVIDADKHMFSS